MATNSRTGFPSLTIFSPELSRFHLRRKYYRAIIGLEEEGRVKGGRKEREWEGERPEEGRTEEGEMGVGRRVWSGIFRVVIISREDLIRLLRILKLRGVTYDGLPSRPGGVRLLLAASCYRNQDKLWPDEPVDSKASQSVPGALRFQILAFFLSISVIEAALVLKIYYGQKLRVVL